MKNDAPHVEEARILSEAPDDYTVTAENLDEFYMPRPGIRYEVAEGCFRVLSRATYDLDLEAGKLIAKEDITVLDPEKPGHSGKIRYKIAEMVTTGDKFPKKGVDMEIVSRIVTDFFTWRVWKTRRRPDS